MKAIYLTFFLIHFQAHAQLEGNSESIDQSTKPRYPYPSAMVKYEVTGDASGEATLAFDRNGWRSLESRSVTIKRYGLESTEKRIELIDGDFQYAFDPNAAKGTRTKDQKWSSLLKYKDHPEALEAIMVSMGAVRVGVDTLLGRPCNRWDFEKGTISSIWEWNGIPIKISKKLPGLKYDQQAISISMDTEVPPALFVLPEGIAWQ